VSWISSTERDSARARGALLLFHPLDQASEHALDFTDAGVESLLLFLREEAQVAREQQKVFKFACRPDRCVKELPKFRLTRPAATLGNVRRYGRGGASHLARQSVSLWFGKGGGGRVDPQNEGMALLPDLQLSVILHNRDNQLTIFLSYLQLKTDNCQRAGADSAN
jgi:hypothetical protein